MPKNDSGCLSVFFFIVFSALIYYLNTVMLNRRIASNVKSVEVHYRNSLTPMFDSFNESYPALEDSFEKYKALTKISSESEYAEKKNELQEALLWLVCEDTSDKFCLIVINQWKSLVGSLLTEIEVLQIKAEANDLRSRVSSVEYNLRGLKDECKKMESAQAER
jgi:hypothetical protein